MGRSYSDILFTQTGFLVGVGSAVSLGGNYYPYNFSPTPVIADIRALSADFQAVGEDMRIAMRSYEQEIAKPQTSGQTNA
jgi:hypothetical protein